MIRSIHYGPAFTNSEPRQIVIHSVESEIVAGLARSLANGWFRNPANQTSAHNIADPREQIDMVSDRQRAWHCGNGNSTSWGKEQVGRARFTRAQWTTPLGMAMLRNSATDAARRCKEAGIPARWLSLTQLANNEKGFCTHNDMRIVRGGTTHTDPGPGFPYDLYMDLVRRALGQDEGDDDMPSAKEIADEILNRQYKVTDPYLASIGRDPYVEMTIPQMLAASVQYNGTQTRDLLALVKQLTTKTTKA